MNSTENKMKPQRKYRLGTGLGRLVIITGGWGWGVKPVLRCTNLHLHLPPQFTQFNWLFGSHGGLLAYKCVVTGNTKNQLKDCDQARMRTRQLQCVETRGDSLGVSNTTNTLEQKNTTSWAPMGQETDKCQAPTI